MNTDLSRSHSVWSEDVKKLKNIVAQLESKGYTNLQSFQIHWDHQLYKALEIQYVMGLLDLNHRLPDIHVDIIFRYVQTVFSSRFNKLINRKPFCRQQEIQFRPTIEEIRFLYFAELRKFIERPITFKGLSDQSSKIFRVMVEM